jgi:hypothetical protein
MSNAWETTTDDIALVLAPHKIIKNEDGLEALLKELDDYEIESAALNGEVDSDDEQTLLNQTDCAFAEIERQLVELAIIPHAIFWQ